MQPIQLGDSMKHAARRDHHRGSRRIHTMMFYEVRRDVEVVPAGVSFLPDFIISTPMGFIYKSASMCILCLAGIFASGRTGGPEAAKRGGTGMTGRVGGMCGQEGGVL